MKLHPHSLLVVFILASIVSGCSTSKRLEDYPRREIDRPYTLHEGMVVLPLTLSFNEFKSKTETYYGYFPNNNFFQRYKDEHGLSIGATDRFQVGLIPDFKYELHFDEDNNYWGIRAHLLDFGIGRYTLFYTPQVEIKRRQQLRNDWAIDFKLSANMRFDNQHGKRNRLISFDINSLKQISDKLALGPSASMLVNSAFIRIQNEYLKASGSSVILPVGAKAVWSVSRRWDIGAEFQLARTKYYTDGPFEPEYGKATGMYYFVNFGGILYW